MSEFLDLGTITLKITFPKYLPKTIKYQFHLIAAIKFSKNKKPSHKQTNNKTVVYPNWQNQKYRVDRTAGARSSNKSGAARRDNWSTKFHAGEERERERERASLEKANFFFSVSDSALFEIYSTTFRATFPQLLLQLQLLKAGRALIGIPISAANRRIIF